MPASDLYSRAFYELSFENRFLKSKGASFQDYFATIMEKRYPFDFIRVRPWGNSGDRKNDGYVRSTRHLFQVYAPNEMKASEACSKIREDFHGALPFWKEYFDTWIFVHNSYDGLGPQIVATLLELDTTQAEVKCSSWGREELRHQVNELSDSDLASIFGPAPSMHSVANVRVDDLLPIVLGLNQAKVPPIADLRPVPSDKLSRNHLSPNVGLLLGMGMLKVDLVRKIFDGWIDPELGDRIAKKFNDDYLELKNMNMTPDEIFNSLWDVARNGQPRQAETEIAVLAVMAHLFESCDIFERELVVGAAP